MVLSKVDGILDGGNRNNGFFGSGGNRPTRPTRGRSFSLFGSTRTQNNTNQRLSTEDGTKLENLLDPSQDEDVKQTLNDQVVEEQEEGDDEEKENHKYINHRYDQNDESNYDYGITGTTTQIGASLGALLSSKQFANFTLTGVQFGICFYLAKAIWKAMVEVIDELGSASSGFLQDDYDSPYLNADAVDSATDSLVYEALVKQKQQEIGQYKKMERDESDNTSSGRTIGDIHDRKTSDTSSSTSTDANSGDQDGLVKPTRTRHSPFVSSLAMRLHASGLPLVSPPHKPTKSVQSVLKSLTRSEGKLLSSTLLSPMGENNNANGDMSSITQQQQSTQNVLQMWKGIGGLEEAKDGLLDLAFPLMEKHLLSLSSPGDVKTPQNTYLDANYYGGLLQNPPGVLLYGPPGKMKNRGWWIILKNNRLNPFILSVSCNILTRRYPCFFYFSKKGCGKTMLCRALAGTVNARFLCVTPSTLLRKYFGETNINVKSLFTLARKISPCIIFIDEMEGLFRERRTSGSEEHEVNRELKTEFMQHWDGINSNGVGSDGVIVIGATNRPFDVDSAFLRRMPRSFFIGLPDRDSRIKILSSMLSNVPLARNFDIEYLADATVEYTPSDMKEVLRTAALFPLREARAKVLQSPPEAGFMAPQLRPLETKDVMEACRRVSPTQLTRDYREALLTFASKASGRNNFNVNNPHHPHSNSNYGNGNDFGNNNYNSYNMNQNPGPDGPCFVSDFTTIPNPQDEGAGFPYRYGDHSDEYDDDSYSYDEEEDL